MVRSNSIIFKAGAKIAVIIMGNMLYAAGVVFFILPSGLITGGTTGIALIANHFGNIPVSAFVGIFNIVMFVLGMLILGRTFALTTLVSTIAYPAMLGLLERAAGDFVLTDDKLLCALFGGLCIGASLAMIIRLGASTGGMDIPPLILNKKLGIPVSVSMYVFDFSILAGQMFFSEKQAILYGILLVMVYTLTLDKLLTLGASRTKIEIISRNPEKLRSAILENMDRGVTMLHARTGYLGIETDVLYCVISPRELHKMETIIRREDPEAFIVLSKASSVYGRGFSIEKNYI
ncbi:MAG: YitT family protein [Mogibacterium sp.]|nr:YitT family protein [Mogibacterium sp.]